MKLSYIKKKLRLAKFMQVPGKLVFRRDSLQSLAVVGYTQEFEEDREYHVCLVHMGSGRGQIMCYNTEQLDKEL